MDFCMSVAAEVILKEMKKQEGRAKNVNMVASGCAGKTLDQFLKFLGSQDIDELKSESSKMMSPLSSNDDGVKNLERKRDAYYLNDGSKGPLFSFANGFWIDRRFPLLASFKKVTKSIYKAGVKNVDLVNKIQAVFCSFVYLRE